MTKFIIIVVIVAFIFAYLLLNKNEEKNSREAVLKRCQDEMAEKKHFSEHLKKMLNVNTTAIATVAGVTVAEVEKELGYPSAWKRLCDTDSQDVYSLLMFYRVFSQYAGSLMEKEFPSCEDFYKSMKEGLANHYPKELVKYWKERLCTVIEDTPWEALRDQIYSGQDFSFHIKEATEYFPWINEAFIDVAVSAEDIGATMGFCGNDTKPLEVIVRKKISKAKTLEDMLQILRDIPSCNAKRNSDFACTCKAANLVYEKISYNAFVGLLSGIQSLEEFYAKNIYLCNIEDNAFDENDGWKHRWDLQQALQKKVQSLKEQETRRLQEIQSKEAAEKSNKIREAARI